MALSDDQKAILRLLSQRGAQGYEDLSALLGMSVDEVHSRAKAAAADLESEGIPAPVVPEPGGSSGDSPSAPVEPQEPAPEPPTPAPAEKPPVDPPAPAEKPVPEPPVPIAEKKPTAQASSPRPPRPKSPSRPRASKPKLALPSDRGARIGVLAGGAVVVLLVILLVTGVLGDDGGSSTSSSSSAGGSGTASQEAGSGQLTQATLEPVDGGDASGRALFGRSGKNVLLQVEAEGLEPSPQGQSYVVWLARSPQQMLPLAASKVDDSGEIAARYQVPTEVLAFLASGSFDEIAITQIGDSDFRNSVAQARKEKKSPAYTGTAVLRGQITGPIVGVAKKGG